MKSAIPQATFLDFSCLVVLKIQWGRWGMFRGQEGPSGGLKGSIGTSGEFNGAMGFFVWFSDDSQDIYACINVIQSMVTTTD